MIEQGTDEWRKIRLGKVTASRVADVVAKTKTGFGASRANYMAELIAERLTGTAAPSYTNAAMQHGTDTEPEAIIAYEFLKNIEVERVGFVEHPKMAMTGASPDGLVGADGLVEVKCPNVATHIDTLLGKPIDGKYVAQMQWQMASVEREWCDFCSYDPRLPEHMRLFVARVVRDEGMIAELEREIRAFLTEIDEKLRQLRARYELRSAA